MKTRIAMLVYQAGIANVFSVSEVTLHHPMQRKARRLLQGSFRECEAFSRGLWAAGVPVSVASCNQAGDITDADWQDGLDDCPFREQARSIA